MINKMINIIRRLILKHRVDSNTYVSYLRNLGMRIGDRVTIYNPRSTIIDETRPWLIQMGNDVKITAGVTMLTHGYDWSVLHGVYDTVLGSSGKITIGNNVFIGMHTTILKGVTIGDNVIIGANSLVNKNVPDNVVVAGNPARVVMPLDEYYDKRKKLQLNEAVELYTEYVKVYGKEPTKEIFSEFFFLFENGYEDIDDSYKEKMSLHGTYDETLNKLQSIHTEFNGFGKFLDYARKQKDD